MSRETDRARFYEERDRRTIGYGVVERHLERPVRIAIGPDAAANPAGQALVLAAINMACRIHRRVGLVVPSVELMVPSVVPGRDLSEAAEALALAIDPFIDLSHDHEDDSPTLGIGDTPATLWVGADGFAAEVARRTRPITNHPASMLGAGLAACLGSSSLLHLVTGAVPAFRRVSLWRFEEGPAAEAGPSLAPGPIDVGDFVVVVGAGAVGSAILYWLRLLGTSGRWVVVDPDQVELHNTNRSLGLFPAFAGWADGTPGGPVAYKAQVGADLIRAESVSSWYHEWAPKMGGRPDLVIPVANGRSIRPAVDQLGLPLIVHGTTSPRWTAELHRHGPDDACMSCRFPPDSFSDFACAEGPLVIDGASSKAPGQDKPSEDRSGDSALPFLSGAAGLLVVAALAQLATGYMDNGINVRRLLFQSGVQRSWQPSVKECKPGCHGRLTLATRRKLNVGSRWAWLDGHT